MLASIVPQTLTILAFAALAWLAWRVRRLRMLSAFLWTLVVLDLAFVAWFVAEAYPCTPAECENDQAAVILVFMFLLDIVLALGFAVAGVLAWLRRP